MTFGFVTLFSFIPLILILAIILWLIVSVQTIKQSLKTIERNTEMLASRDQDAQAL
ncbi:MAG: hypothetical protein IBX64_04325 [Actinobacteria bacterium]|nr:hypothetical protein [Actinomycetota bacterium]